MTNHLLTRLIPDDAEPAAEPARPTLTTPVRRLRLLLITMCLSLLVFAQSAGNTAADTKIDLVVSPWRFLHRSLQLWDPLSGAGQLQNQAYGYLFPIGPFFGLLHGLAVPAWEIQRAWQTALVVAGFLGVYRLSRHFGSTGFWPQVAAGLGYALAPRMISELSTISSELMPVAALPWVLLPLVSGARSGSVRRAAGRSGVAVLFAGGVNAAATLAVLPVPALFLLTRGRGRRRAGLLRWWVLAVLLACLWWILPLLLLGSYSPPFLNWIESASTTTLPTSLSASLRGVDHWESYLGAGVWPGGWILASAPAAILATAAVGGIGLAGVARRDQPHRGFLWTTLLLGLICLTFGHLASAGPPFAGHLQQLLDGPLAAFRNVHKFDPLVRLPIALGIGTALANLALPRWRRVASMLLPLRAVAVVAVCAVGAIAISPMLTNQSVASPRVTTEPSWWVNSAHWLAANDGAGRALLVPASTSPVYLWGGTVDTALQPVATTPWTVRDAVPLAQAGYIRFLDVVTQRLAAGRPDPTLVSLLNRAGIDYLVLANDINAYQSGATAPMLIHATVDATPGITLAQSFGPTVGGGNAAPDKLLDGGASSPHPSVQIYRVGSTDLVSLEPLSAAVAANGSTDELGPLVDAGLTADRPVFFGADATAAGLPADQTVLTDGIRRRQASFGNAFAKSDTLTAAQPFTGSRGAYDYLPTDPGPLSTMAYSGIADVTASSSGADTGAYYNLSAANAPYSAVDGNPDTAWRSGAPSGAVGQWLQVDLDTARSLRTVTVRFTEAGRAGPSRVVVRTDHGSRSETVRADSSVQTLTVPAGDTRTLRITVAAVAAGGYGGTVGISELALPGVTPVRSLVVPTVTDPAQLLFAATSGSRASCLTVRDRPLCDASYAVAGEEDAGIDRTFTLTKSADYRFGAQVVLQPSTALATALGQGQTVRATASSTLSGDPRLLAESLVDGDPRTSWQAARGDAQPLLTLTTATPRTISGVRISTDSTAAAARPVRVTVTAGDQRFSGTLPADGHISFARAVRTSRVTVRITEATLRQTLSSLNFTTSLLPVGLSAITLDGAAQSGLPSLIRLGCDAGLAMTVDGVRIPLQVTATRAAVLAGRPVPATVCGTPTRSLGVGGHTAELSAGPTARPVAITASRLSVPPTSITPAATGITEQVRRWNATDRAVTVQSPQRSVLVVRENANAGWRATLAGHRLTSVRVDGWQQGFLVPAGSSGTVTLTYAPQRAFTIGLWLGVLAVLALLVLALWPSRSAPDDDVLAEAVLPRLMILAAVTAAAVLLTGLWGLGVVAVVQVVSELVTSTGRRISPWVPLVLLLLPALVQTQANAFSLFSAANSTPSQLLCLAAVVLGVLGPGWRVPRRQGADA